MSDAAPRPCFHCGLPVTGADAPTVEINKRQETVCCHGCAAAALLIESAGLADYYLRRTSPAPRPGTPATDSWSAYDRPEAQAALIHNDGRSTTNLLVEGLRCAACAWLLERRLLQLPGVTDATVNVMTGRGRVEFADVKLSTIFRTIADLGYRAHLLGRADSLAVALRERHAALKRLAVAGLGMMQVMMIAVALYAGASTGMSPVIRQYLCVASLVIATPVALYGGAPFFAGASSALRARHLTMDVPVSIGILLAFVLSAVATLRDSGAVYFDSVVMVIFLLLLGRYFEMLARHRAGSTVEALARVVPAVARRVVGTRTEDVPVAALAVGDVVEVEAGAVMPVDAALESPLATVDESLITGESRPVTKRAGDTVLAGALNVQWPALIRVTATGAATVLAGIVQLAERAQAERPRASRLADRIAPAFIGFVLICAAATCLVWMWIDPAKAWGATIAVLVVSCPCALSLATPVATTATAAALRRRGILVTRTDAFEALAAVDCALFDKTGTLTEGRPRIVSSDRLGATSIEECYRIAGALERHAAHPIARAFAASATPPVENASAVPGAGVEGWIEGRRYRIGRASYVEEIAGPSPAPAADAGVCLGGDGRWLARFCWEDTLRPSAARALAALTSSGLSLEVLSGDHPRAVASVAEAAGIKQWRAALSPKEKMDRLQELQRRGARVMVVGDGINDAPSFGAADVSIAMGSGSAIARASADVIILGGDLGEIPLAIEEARRTRTVIRQNLLWALIYNAASIPLAAFGMVPPWIAAAGMSLSSLLVIGNASRLLRARKRDDTGASLPALRRAELRA